MHTIKKQVNSIEQCINIVINVQQLPYLLSISSNLEAIEGGLLVVSRVVVE